MSKEVVSRLNELLISNYSIPHLFVQTFQEELSQIFLILPMHILIDLNQQAQFIHHFFEGPFQGFHFKGGFMGSILDLGGSKLIPQLFIVFEELLIFEPAVLSLPFSYFLFQSLLFLFQLPCLELQPIPLFFQLAVFLLFPLQSFLELSGAPCSPAQPPLFPAWPAPAP